MTSGFQVWGRNLRRASGLVLALATATSALAGKDIGPAGGCDAFAKGTSAWNDCVSPAAHQLSDADLFYAGYWMARLERYDQAIAYLSAAKTPDVRTLTYLGFATRKSGNVYKAFAYYERALALDPDYVVARAYLGEAFVTVGNRQAAQNQLAEIARRCGATCAAYDELARHLARSEPARG